MLCYVIQGFHSSPKYYLTFNKNRFLYGKGMFLVFHPMHEKLQDHPCKVEESCVLAI